MPASRRRVVLIPVWLVTAGAFTVWRTRGAPASRDTFCQQSDILDDGRF
jgi:hypothetical protein